MGTACRRSECRCVEPHSESPRCAARSPEAPAGSVLVNDVGEWARPSPPPHFASLNP